MRYKRKMLTKDVIKWFDSYNLPVVRLEENGRLHGVKPNQVHEAMVQVYEELAETEFKPTRLAWTVWEKAKEIQVKHHEIATDIIKRLRKENERLRQKVADTIWVMGFSFVLFIMAFIIVMAELGILQ